MDPGGQLLPPQRTHCAWRGRVNAAWTVTAPGPNPRLLEATTPDLSLPTPCWLLLLETITVEGPRVLAGGEG